MGSEYLPEEFYSNDPINYRFPGSLGGNRAHSERQADVLNETRSHDLFRSSPGHPEASQQLSAPLQHSSYQSWETESLAHLLEIPEHLVKSHSGITDCTLGVLKPLAVYYLKRFLGLQTGDLPRHTPNRKIIEAARTAGLERMVIRLHLENKGTIPLLPSHAKYISHRQESIRSKNERRLHTINRIEAHRLAGKVTYFEGIELVLGRERDSVLRPRIQELFRRNKQDCRDSLARFGLKSKDLRNWNIREFSRALFALSQVDGSLWELATGIHCSKVRRVNISLL